MSLHQRHAYDQNDRHHRDQMRHLRQQNAMNRRLLWATLAAAAGSLMAGLASLGTVALERWYPLESTDKQPVVLECHWPGAEEAAAKSAPNPTPHIRSAP
jgi:hypothetical protein